MEFWSALRSKLIRKSNSIYLFIIFCLTLTGCHSGQEPAGDIAEVKNDTIDEQEDSLENEINSYENDLIEENLIREAVKDEYSYIDYDYIEQYHEILFHNIADSPKDDYDNTALAESLKEDMEKDKELLESASGEVYPLSITYHVFDFNDDGLEDYLVCLEGTFWQQDDDEYTIRIYIQEQNGTLREVFEDYVHFRGFSVAVLTDKAEGYHLLALPGTNSLLRYDEDRKRYAFCEIEDKIEEASAESEIHVSMTGEEYEEKKEWYDNIKHIDMSIYIDYEFIEAKHKILKHNICIYPEDVNENDILREFLKDEMEYDRQMYERGLISEPPYADYFLFDFNDDGLEDYLVCYHSILRSGSGGNHVCIYVQESDGSLSEVFSITMRLHEYASPNEHAPMAILDEKDDGYYAFVLVGNNRIIRYHAGEGQYEFEYLP